ncbi:MAG: dTDP-4-dehydrorhamnose reductase [Flavobacteriaceae bacterium]
MKRVLVTGANGQLGLALQAAAKDFPLDLVFLDKSALDITNAEAINKVFATQSFAICINAAAYTQVDDAETNKAIAYAINATAVENLAKACKQHGCWLVHISTDYVFDGALDRPYTPSDAPNPLNVYGASKLAGEQAIQAIDGTYSIVRTSWLYSQYGNNFYTKLQAQLGAGKTLQVTADQKGCPTRAEDLAVHLLKGIDNQQLATGISHYCGSEVMTWLDLSRRLFPEQKVLEWGGANSHTVRPKKVILKNNNI